MLQGLFWHYGVVFPLLEINQVVTGSDVKTPDLFFKPVRVRTLKMFQNVLISYIFRVIFNGAMGLLPVYAGESVVTVV